MYKLLRIAGVVFVFLLTTYTVGLVSFQTYQNVSWMQSFRNKKEVALSTSTAQNSSVLSESCSQPSGGCGTGYYWNSSQCSCRLVCITPQNGCGSGYYYDTNSCNCIWSPTSTPAPTTSSSSSGSGGSSTTCSAPSAGCGSNYSWDSYSCTCKQNTTTSCVSPTYGCGTNYSWDSTSCSCKSSSGSGGGGGSNCISPTYGCGMNYSWDSGSCSCKYTGSTSCVSPTYGCGANYYWDNSSCSCKYSGSTSTTCVSPTYGCGTGYSWDSNSCYCKPNTVTASTCTAPTYGCGTGYYWDSYSCSCKYSTTVTTNYCTAPTSGCGTNYYWDTGSCICKPYTTTTTTAVCGITTGSCGSSSYWDYASCTCKPYSTSTYTTASLQSTAYAVFDRLAYETPDRIRCVQSLLTTDEYQKLRYLQGTTSTDQQMIADLGKKAQSCWNTTVAVANSAGTPAQSQTAKTPIAQEQCLITSLGETSYKDITSGIRKATFDEQKAFEKCYGVVKTEAVTFATSTQKISTQVDSCLKTVLTQSVYDKVKAGSQEVPFENRKSVDACFGIIPKPFEEGKTYKVPDEVKSCLLAAVGDARLTELSGGSIPTDDEKNKAESCFVKLNKTQVAFLPPPVEQVPFIEIKPEVVVFSAVNQDKKKENTKVSGGKLTLSGKGPVNSTVTLYIFSDPIVVTTKTDENGEWVYELEKPLTGEKHIAYATVRESSGKMVKSTVFDFTVVASEENLENAFIPEAQTKAGIQSTFLIIAFGLIAVAFVIVVVYQSIGYMRKMNVADKDER